MSYSSLRPDAGSRPMSRMSLLVSSGSTLAPSAFGGPSMTARSSASFIVPRLTWLSCTATRRPSWLWMSG